LSRSTDTHPCPRKIVGRIEAVGFLDKRRAKPAPASLLREEQGHNTFTLT